MNFTKTSLFLVIAFCLILVGPVLGESIPGVTEDKLPFPAYGTGEVIVRVYTDYFCSPCRASEAVLEPLLIDLLKSKKVTVTFVDTPVHRDSQLFASYFLYALNARNDFENALRARSALFEAARNKISGKDALEKFLKEKGVTFAFFNVTPILKKLNRLLENDRVTATPTCVIFKNDTPDKKVGSREIINALKEIR